MTTTLASITMEEFQQRVRQHMGTTQQVYKAGYEEGRKVGYAAGLAEARRLMEVVAPEPKGTDQ